MAGGRGRYWWERKRSKRETRRPRGRGRRQANHRQIQRYDSQATGESFVKHALPDLSPNGAAGRRRQPQEYLGLIWAPIVLLSGGGRGAELPGCAFLKRRPPLWRAFGGQPRDARPRQEQGFGFWRKNWSREAISPKKSDQNKAHR